MIREKKAKYFDERAGRAVWVGIHYDEKQNLVKITDGSRVFKNDLPWSAGEPNNYKRKENCIMSGWTFNDHSFSWRGFNDLYCDHLNRFACEKTVS